MKRCIYILLLIHFSCFDYQKDCVIKDVRTIYSIEMQNNSAIMYQHLVLIEDFDKRCLDSARIMRLINNYIDTVSTNKPIEGIELFNSIKNFDLGESLSQPKSIYKNCLVSVWFDHKTKQPYEFVFYNWLGNESYRGVLWNP